MSFLWQIDLLDLAGSRANAYLQHTAAKMTKRSKGSAEMKSSSSLFWSVRNNILLPWVRSGTQTVLAIQQYRTPFLDIFWRCVTVLGNELIYLVALPYLFWNVSVHMVYHVVCIWAAGFYFGNGLKNMLRLPRPPCPPVQRMEHDYENEYGFPSTHALNAFTLPVTIAISLCWASIQAGAYADLMQPLAIALCFAAAVSFSRLYLGVHSPADLCGGFLLGIVLLLGWFCTGLADFLEHASRWPSPFMPLVFVGITLVSLACFPIRTMNNPSFADVTAINSTTCGIFTGGWQFQWVAFNHGQFSPGLGIGLVRALIGYVALVIGKVVLKAVMLWIARHVFGVRFDEQEGQHKDQQKTIDQLVAQKDEIYAFVLSPKQEFWLFLTKFVSYFYLGYFSAMGTTVLFPLLNVQ